jgi:hypothetical protein
MSDPRSDESRYFETLGPSDSPVDRLLFQQSETYMAPIGTKRGPPDNGVEGMEDGVSNRVRLATDQVQAHLIRLCINNFSRYAQGKEKFFLSIGELFTKECGSQSPDVSSWMRKREQARQKEVAEGMSHCNICLPNIFSADRV